MLACVPCSCGVVAINALFGHALVHLQMLFKLNHAPNKLNSTVLDKIVNYISVIILFSQEWNILVLTCFVILYIYIYIYIFKIN